jgi:hypothetical protein
MKNRIKGYLLMLATLMLIYNVGHTTTKSVNKSKVSQDSLNLEIVSRTLKNHQQKLEDYNKSLSQVSQRFNVLESRISGTEQIQDSLFVGLESNVRDIENLANDLGVKIEKSGSETAAQIITLDSDLQKSQLYWVIVSLTILIIAVLMFVVLRKRIKSSRSDIETQIKNTKAALEEESIKLDGQLVKVFQQQLELIDKSSIGKTEDHTLVLKIADRLTAMETNLYRMDANTRGLNVLKNLVKSTKENFQAKEYEIIDMLGKDYKEGMEVIATFIPSDDLETGKQIITKIIKPQVNYKGKKIQAAEIEVSVGE